MFDMMKMMGKFKEAQDKMKEIKNQLDTIKVESESGAGLVKVEVNGKKEVISIKIDKSIIIRKNLLDIILNSGIWEFWNNSEKVIPVNI